ncbi:hypothetical protein ACFYOT_41150 [Saccharothrix saharensis]|uniref:hypothetical protein n=1 Tax=Saccharothrix saharensis TaxID=571190 RepID=UPI0036840E86
MDRTVVDALVTSMAGWPRERVFRELCDRGRSPIETIHVASKVLGLSLAEAKAAIFESPAWRDRHAGWARVHDEVEEVAKGPLQR